MIELKDRPIAERQRLDAAVESFLTGANPARFGFVSRRFVEGGEKVTIWIPADEPLRKKLLELANKAELGVSSIYEFHAVIRGKGFRQEAQNEQAVSWSRTRKI